MTTFWKNNLLRLFTNPEEFEILAETPEMWIINDKYPKAKIHMLMIPKIRIIRGVADLTSEHLPLLHRMVVEATKISALFPEHRFIVGFHKKPSLFQLHLHIISDDLSLAKAAQRRKFLRENMLTIDDVITMLSR